MNRKAESAMPQPRESWVGVMERRWGRRITCGAQASITAGSRFAGTGRIRDVSMSGAFIETPVELRQLSPVGIAILRADAKYGEELTAMVVRQAPDGFGIEWTETSTGPICPVLGCVALCDAARARF